MPEENDKYDIPNLVSDIKHKKLINSSNIALKTEALSEKLISQGKWRTAQELMDLLRERINYITENLENEAASVNIMRHMLKVIRDVFEECTKKKGESQSFQNIASLPPKLDYSEQLENFKTCLLDHLTEYKVELETSTENIASQAPEHIHMKEIILTVGKSNTIEKFFKYAAKKRQFTVIVVEGVSGYNTNDDGRAMAANLTSCKNIQTVVIPNSAVFAMMSRVNKVIIGTHTVLANGGLRAASGMHAVALAAKYYSVPVTVLAHMYKFSPVHVGSHEHDMFTVCASPANILPYSSGSILNNIEVFNPIFDYVPPELVTLFISHQGGHAPSYVYRLLTELYNQDDYEI